MIKCAVLLFIISWFMLVFQACATPTHTKEKVIYYTKDQVFNPQWNKARADFENGLTSDEDFRYVVKHIQDQIENEKLSLDIELKAINQYIDERMGQ